MPPCDHSHPWVAVHLPGGHVVHAHPPIGVDEFERLHDVTHLVVARATGRITSPGLRAAAGLPVDDDLVAYDEAAVIAITEAARALENAARHVARLGVDVGHDRV